MIMAATPRAFEAMVGSPKSLTDLRKIDASVRVTCRACGRVRLLDREKLILDLMARRRNLAWSALPTYFRCAATGCGSKDVRLVAVPFAPAEIDGETLVGALVTAADRLIEALRVPGGGVPALQEMAEARAGFESAKIALVTWVRLAIARDQRS
jgi:hypothetical protein